MPQNRRFTLARRPSGVPTPADFELVESEAAAPGEGEVLLETLYLSLDPYMRGRMSEAKSYVAPLRIGDVITGATVGRVLASASERFAPGDLVVGYTGWQDHPTVAAKLMRKVDPALAPISTALGILGMPGMTAYVGLEHIGRPQEGETLVVAAATGPVGCAVGQIARIRGARAIGIAGGPDKCDYAVREFGFDACIDRRAPDFAEQLARACPDGIDVYWENVGGAVLDAVLPRLNDFARVPVCGLIAQYNDMGAPEGPDRMPALMRKILVSRLRVQGFIVYDYADDELRFRTDMAGWIRSGQVRYKEDVVEGLDAAPEAFIRLFRGDNFGKLLVRVAE